MVGIEQVKFFVTRVGTDDLIFSVDVASEDKPISFDWIKNVLQKKLETPATFVDFKYEDDEFDQVTFSSDHETHEGITIIETAQRSVFNVYVTAVEAVAAAEQSVPNYLGNVETSPEEEGKQETEQKTTSEVEGSSFKVVWDQFLVYLKSLNTSARENLADAIQLGVQELRANPRDPKSAILHAIALFPDDSSKELAQLAELIKHVGSHQWEQLKAIVASIPVEAWNFIEGAIPRLVSKLPADPRDSFFKNMIPGLFTRGFGCNGAAAAESPMSPMMGMLGALMRNAAAMGRPNAEEKNENSNAQERRVSLDVKAVEEDDGAIVVQPGTQVIRTWQVTNRSESPLPEGVKLSIEADPDQLISQDTTAVVLPSIQPGETVEVSQLLQAPLESGLFHVDLVLKTLYGHGTSIGPTLPVDMYVVV